MLFWTPQPPSLKQSGVQVKHPGRSKQTNNVLISNRVHWGVISLNRVVFQYPLFFLNREAERSSNVPMVRGWGKAANTSPDGIKEKKKGRKKN